jgi:hypothetical protein
LVSFSDKNPRPRMLTSANQVVPENACKINSRLEKFIEVPGNHLDICNIVTSTQVGKWIQQPVAAAVSRISRELQDGN